MSIAALHPLWEFADASLDQVNVGRIGNARLRNTPPIAKFKNMSSRKWHLFEIEKEKYDNRNDWKY